MPTTKKTIAIRCLVCGDVLLQATASGLTLESTINELLELYMVHRDANERCNQEYKEVAMDLRLF